MVGLGRPTPTLAMAPFKRIDWDSYSARLAQPGSAKPIVARGSAVLGGSARHSTGQSVTWQRQLRDRAASVGRRPPSKRRTPPTTKGGVSHSDPTTASVGTVRAKKEKPTKGRASHYGMSAAAALASLAARSSAATPSSPVGPRRLSAAVLNNVIGPGSSRRTAGAASSPIFSSTC